MIKKLIKILIVFFFIFVLSILYLSFFGIKTDKFNKRIADKVLEINKNIKLDIKDLKLLLNPYNFTINISTKDPRISLGTNELKIKSVKTNVSLKALIIDNFALDELQISTKAMSINDVILFARFYKNSTGLFLLDKTIKDGFLTADIKIRFDSEGKIKKDYEIKGFIKNGKLEFLNKLSVHNLNFNFNVHKKKYSLTKINLISNNIKLSSPLIEIGEKKDLFSLKGKIQTAKKDFNKDQLSIIFGNILNIKNIEKVRFSSENDISFNVSKKLKFNDINVKSKVNLEQLVLKNDFINLDSYLPNLKEVISFENHKITIDYKKKILGIKGHGNILINNKPDTINYEIIKNRDKFKFNTNIDLKNNKLLIDFLDYEKKENLDSSILMRGIYQHNNKISFDLITLKEKNNIISFKNLNLLKNFKIVSLDSFKLNYLNKNKIKNQLFLKKTDSNYNIEGDSFDATKLINKIMENDDEKTSLLHSFNSKINIKIKKTHIDKVNFINNLTGTLNFKDNEIDDLNLKSFFSDNKKINLSIETNEKKEKITKLYTDYPKPLIKRYNFIKGFEDGYLIYNSVKQNGISNSLLIIDNFKVKEVPVFAKLLSLASLQGIADLLTGEGIRFTDFEMKFSNKKKLTTIEEMYAIGPAVSILMEGYIESKKLVSLRGTLVPATTINRSIASIPLLGKILVGKKTGEGVFGVSFKIKGPPKDLKTSVNPIKTLTPRFITRTLDKIKKN